MAVLEEYETGLTDSESHEPGSGLVNLSSEALPLSGSMVAGQALGSELNQAVHFAEHNLTLGQLSVGQEAVIVPTDSKIYGEETGIYIPGIITRDNSACLGSRRNSAGIHFEPKPSELWQSFRKVITDEMLWYKEIKMFAKFDFSLFGIEAALIPVLTSLTARPGLNEVRKKPLVVDYNVGTLFPVSPYIVNRR